MENAGWESRNNFEDSHLPSLLGASTSIVYIHENLTTLPAELLTNSVDSAFVEEIICDEDDHSDQEEDGNDDDDENDDDEEEEDILNDSEEYNLDKIKLKAKIQNQQEHRIKKINIDNGGDYDNDDDDIIDSKEGNEKGIKRKKKIRSSSDTNTNTNTNIKANNYPLLNIRTVNLHSNYLTCLGVQFPHLPNLQHLNISSNELTAFDPPKFSLPQLKTLDLSCNKITDFGRSFDKLENLEKLLLPFNCVTTLIDDDLPELLSLVELDMRDNNIGSPFPLSAADKFPKLEQLQLQRYQPPSPNVNLSSNDGTGAKRSSTFAGADFGAVSSLSSSSFLLSNDEINTETGKGRETKMKSEDSSSSSNGNGNFEHANPLCSQPGYVSMTVALFRNLEKLDNLGMKEMIQLERDECCGLRSHLSVASNSKPNQNENVQKVKVKDVLPLPAKETKETKETFRTNNNQVKTPVRPVSSSSFSSSTLTPRFDELLSKRREGRSFVDKQDSSRGAQKSENQEEEENKIHNEEEYFYEEENGGDGEDGADEREYKDSLKYNEERQIQRKSSKNPWEEESEVDGKRKGQSYLLLRSQIDRKHSYQLFEVEGEDSHQNKKDHVFDLKRTSKSPSKLKGTLTKTPREDNNKKPGTSTSTLARVNNGLVKDQNQKRKSSLPTTGMRTKSSTARTAKNPKNSDSTSTFNTSSTMVEDDFLEYTERNSSESEALRRQEEKKKESLLKLNAILAKSLDQQAQLSLMKTIYHWKSIHQIEKIQEKHREELEQLVQSYEEAKQKKGEKILAILREKDEEIRNYQFSVEAADRKNQDLEKERKSLKEDIATFKIQQQQQEEKEKTEKENMHLMEVQIHQLKEKVDIISEKEREEMNMRVAAEIAAAQAKGELEGRQKQMDINYEHYQHLFGTSGNTALQQIQQQQQQQNQQNQLVVSPEHVLREADVRCAGLEAEMRMMRKNEEHYQEDMRRMRLELGEESHKMKALEKEIMELKLREKETTKQFEMEKNQLLKLRHQELEKKSEKYQNQILHLQHAVEEVSRKAADAKIALRATSLREEEGKKVIQELTLLVKEQKFALRQIEKEKRQIEEMKKENLHTLKHTVSEFQEKNENMKMQLEKMKKLSHDQELAIRTLQHARDEEGKEHESKYQAQLKQYHSEKNEWKEVGNKILVKEKIIDDQLQQLNELKGERRDIGIRWEEEKKNYRSRINRLQNDLEDANHEIDELTNTLTSHQNMENYLKTVVADLKGQMNDSLSVSVIDQQSITEYSQNHSHSHTHSPLRSKQSENESENGGGGVGGDVRLDMIHQLEEERGTAHNDNKNDSYNIATKSNINSNRANNNNNDNNNDNIQDQNETQNQKRSDDGSQSRRDHFPNDDRNDKLPTTSTSGLNNLSSSSPSTSTSNLSNTNLANELQMLQIQQSQRLIELENIILHREHNIEKLQAEIKEMEEKKTFLDDELAKKEDKISVMEINLQEQSSAIESHQAKEKKYLHQLSELERDRVIRLKQLSEVKKIVYEMEKEIKTYREKYKNSEKLRRVVESQLNEEQKKNHETQKAAAKQIQQVGKLFQDLVSQQTHTQAAPTSQASGDISTNNLPFSFPFPLGAGVGGGVGGGLGSAGGGQKHRSRKGIKSSYEVQKKSLRKSRNIGRKEEHQFNYPSSNSGSSSLSDQEGRESNASSSLSSSSEEEGFEESYPDTNISHRVKHRKGQSKSKSKSQGRKYIKERSDRDKDRNRKPENPYIVDGMLDGDSSGTVNRLHLLGLLNINKSKERESDADMVTSTPKSKSKVSKSRPTSNFKSKSKFTAENFSTDQVAGKMTNNFIRGRSLTSKSEFQRESKGGARTSNSSSKSKRDSYSGGTLIRDNDSTEDESDDDVDDEEEEEDEKKEQTEEKKATKKALSSRKSSRISSNLDN